MCRTSCIDQHVQIFDEILFVSEHPKSRVLLAAYPLNCSSIAYWLSMFKTHLSRLSITSSRLKHLKILTVL